jgi:hypothetical protein
MIRLLTSVSTAFALAAWLSGCGRGDASARYTPAEADAQAAVAAAMDAWQLGIEPGEIPETSPLVFLTDSYRQPGETLVSYEILGEVPGDVPRCYAVDLQFDPPREEKARFIVVGIDPLWVFRQEDYQLLTHWDHHMLPPPPGSEPAAESNQ